MSIFGRVFFDTRIVVVANNATDDDGSGSGSTKKYRYRVYENDLSARKHFITANRQQQQQQQDVWEYCIVKLASLLLADTPTGGDGSSVVLDIGANFGYHTVHFSRLVPNGHVYAFEPQLENYELLTYNIHSGLNEWTTQNVTTVYKALDGGGTDYTYVPVIDTSVPFNTNSGSGSGSNTSTTMRLVECATLDSMGLDRVDLMRIDAKGFELFVLQGGAETLRRAKPAIIFQLETAQLAKTNVTCNQVVEYLRSGVGGYQLYYIENQSYPSHYLAVHAENIRSFLDKIGGGHKMIHPYFEANDVNGGAPALHVYQKIKL